MANSCLYFFIPYPIEHDLENYFAPFSYDLKRVDSILSENLENPYAILIHTNILKKNPNLIKSNYSRYKVPLIVISEQKDEDLIIQAFSEGADDFLLTPINPRELQARISAISRRVVPKNAMQDREVIYFGDWHLYPASHQLFNNKNKEIILSSGEYALLLTFIQHSQEVLSREYLLQNLRNSDFNVMDRRIDVQISRLRHKIEQDSKKPCLIKTIRNGGYLFTPKVLITNDNVSNDQI